MPVQNFIAFFQWVNNVLCYWRVWGENGEETNQLSA